MALPPRSRAEEEAQELRNLHQRISDVCLRVNAAVGRDFQFYPDLKMSVMAFRDGVDDLQTDIEGLLKRLDADIETRRPVPPLAAE